MRCRCGSFSYSLMVSNFVCFFVFKQKTAYEMRISDWSSDVCSSDLGLNRHLLREREFWAEISGHIAMRTERLEIGIMNMRIAGIDQHAARSILEIVRASCRERVCQYV